MRQAFIVGPQHYKKSLTASFARYPDANYLVILEEDLDISPDILTYFQQLLPVLEKDESLYCISAWNDQVRLTTVFRKSTLCLSLQVMIWKDLCRLT